MQSPGSQGTRDASTPEIEEVFSLAADPQLAENSRQGSERKNRAFALGFEELKSQTMQWGSWQASGRTASVPTVYLYDGRNILGELDVSGNVLARYTQSSGLDQPLAELRSGTTSYYEQDGIGSVSALSNSSGALASTYIYDSFGNSTASTGSLTNPYRYTGREFDPETGIYEYRHRYYDSSVGRFINEDPIGFGGGANFYRYVFNSPTNLVDPWGLAPNCVMTHSGLVCTNANPVSDQIDTLQLFFSGAQRDGNNSLTIPMSCDDVNKILGNSGYYTGGWFTRGNWMTQNPFLFWDPIYHWGGSEWRSLYGFHFRRKYTLCDKSCTLDEFHIDSSNPMFDPGTHFLHDFMGLN